MRTLDDFMVQLPADRRASILSKAAALRSEVGALDAIRKVLAEPSRRFALAAGRDLPALEADADAYIAALRETIEEAGGRLDLVIRMPNHPTIHVDGVGDLRDVENGAEGEAPVASAASSRP